MEKYGDGKLRSREPDRLSPELLQSRMMLRSFSAGSGCSNHLAEYASAISFRAAQEGGLASIVYLFFLHAFISRSQGQAEGIANHVSTSYSGIAGKYIRTSTYPAANCSARRFHQTTQ